MNDEEKRGGGDDDLGHDQEGIGNAKYPAPNVRRRGEGWEREYDGNGTPPDPSCLDPTD